MGVDLKEFKVEGVDRSPCQLHLLKFETLRRLKTGFAHGGDSLAVNFCLDKAGGRGGGGEGGSEGGERGGGGVEGCHQGAGGRL